MCLCRMRPQYCGLGYSTYLENMGVSEGDRGTRVADLVGLSHEVPMRLRLSAGPDALIVEEAS